MSARARDRSRIAPRDAERGQRDPSGAAPGSSGTIRTPLLAAILVELADADEASKRQLADYLQPYLAAGAPQLLDAVEAAARLRLHPETLVRWAREGRVWAVKSGRAWRFRADRLDVRPVRDSHAGAESAPAPRRRRPLPASISAIRGRP